MNNFNPVDETVIRIRNDSTIIVEKNTDGVINSKYINPDDLFSCIKASYEHIGIESGILPENTVFYREEQDNTKRVVIKVPARHHEIKYYETTYTDFPLPSMVFGFVINKHGQITSERLAVVEDTLLKNSSKLYYYPFSNVCQTTYSICIGTNQLPMINDIRKLGSIPYLIIAMPNNDDSFDSKYNKMGFGYRELFENLKDKTTQYYYSEILIENGMSLDDFIKALKK